MNSVVLDTDVASLIFKGELPDSMAAQLIGYRPCITFVALAELVKWTELRSWGPRRRDQLTRWLNAMAVLPGTPLVARKWGEISAFAVKRGRPRPQNDTWIRRILLGLRSAAGDAEREGLRGLRRSRRSRADQSLNRPWTPETTVTRYDKKILTSAANAPPTTSLHDR